MLFQSHFTANLLALAIFQNVKFFFRKYHLCFERKTKFRMFLEILQVQSHSPANLQPSAICKIFMIFFERPIYFLLKNPKFQLWKFWKFMLFQSHSRSKLRPLAILKKLKIFLERRICFLLKNESFQLWTFRELLLFQSHSTAVLLAWDIFKTVKFFFEKPSIFWKKNPKSERFENLTNSVALSGKFATFGDF